MPAILRGAAADPRATAARRRAAWHPVARSPFRAIDATNVLPDFVHVPSGALHPVLDADALDREFAGTEARLQVVSTPLDVWVWSTVRRTWQIGASPADGERLPTDVFVWWPGDPSDRRATRIGGVPFLPHDHPWPRHDGEPLTFVAQFAFHDSRDLVGELPGDVLLVFAADESSLLCGEGLQTIWVPDGARPIDAADCPPPAWSFFRGYGIRCRMWDAPDGYERSYAAHEQFEAIDRAAAARAQVWRTPVIQATKIGGAPYDAQTIRPMGPLRHRFLCQLSAMSLSPADWGRSAGLPHRPPPLPDDAFLRIGDVGATAFYLGPHGKVRSIGNC